MGDGHIRIGDRERDVAVARLQDFHVEGRLTAEELAERVDAALHAKTGADLDALFRDLPGGSPRIPTPVVHTQRFADSAGSPDSPNVPVHYANGQPQRRDNQGFSAALYAILPAAFVVGIMMGMPWTVMVGFLAVLGLYAAFQSRSHQSRSLSALPPGEPPRQLAFFERDQVLQLIRQGKKIHAVKRYRELTGADLKTAKYAVDALERELA